MTVSIDEATRSDELWEQTTRAERGVRPHETWEQAAARMIAENPDLKNICFLESNDNIRNFPNHARTKSAREIFGIRPGETLVDALSRKLSEP
jgi:hypothetical protein